MKTKTEVYPDMDGEYKFYIFMKYFCLGGSLRGVVANVLDWDIGVNEFDIQSRYSVHSYP